MSRSTTKPTKRQASCEDSDHPVHGAQLVAKDEMFLHVDNEDFDQTGRMPSVNWVFAGRTGHLVAFDVSLFTDNVALKLL